MSGPEAWIRALETADSPARFTLDFARLGLAAECRSLTSAEISRSLTFSDEAAARQLLYLSCPSLQQAGEAMTAAGTLARAEDIVQLLPYSDVLQAASLILGYSGGGAGMVRIGSEAGNTPSAADKLSEIRSTELDGYALLRQWAAEDRAGWAEPVRTEPAAADAFSATQSLQQTWAGGIPRLSPQTDDTPQLPPFPAEQSAANITAEQAARILCQRLMDAAGNM